MLDQEKKSFAELIAEAKQLQKKENGKVKGGYVSVQTAREIDLSVNLGACKNIGGCAGSINLGDCRTIDKVKTASR